MADKPSIEEWKELYDAAEEFKKLECWNLLQEEDIFGVQNPETGETGYCCIMGSFGEHIALGVYPGPDGLATLLKMQSGDFPPDEAMFAQKCLMASFEDRDFLMKPDLQTIKSLNLTFRGSTSWPLFRSYLPGHHPWHLTKEEAVFLTLALRQSVDVCRHLEEMEFPRKDDRYLVRVFDKETGTWKDTYSTPEPFKEEYIPVHIHDEDMQTLERLKTSAKHAETWEVDFFHSPFAAKKDDARPHYPYMMMVSDHASNFILGTSTVESRKQVSGFATEFIGLLEDIGKVPSVLMVRKEEVSLVMEPIAAALGIPLKNVTDLSAIDDAKMSLFGFDAMPGAELPKDDSRMQAFERDAQSVIDCIGAIAEKLEKMKVDEREFQRLMRSVAPDAFASISDDPHTKEGLIRIMNTLFFKGDWDKHLLWTEKHGTDKDVEMVKKVGMN